MLRYSPRSFFPLSSSRILIEAPDSVEGAGGSICSLLVDVISGDRGKHERRSIILGTSAKHEWFRNRRPGSKVRRSCETASSTSLRQKFPQKVQVRHRQCQRWRQSQHLSLRSAFRQSTAFFFREKSDLFRLEHPKVRTMVSYRKACLQSNRGTSGNKVP